MGIFHDMIAIRNLAPIPLNVTFDGQQASIPVGDSFLPKTTIIYAKNQNPIKGTADADNPTMSGCQYLVSIVGSKKDRQEPLTPEEWAAHLEAPCRMNVEEFIRQNLGKGETLITRGKNRSVQAKSSFDTGVRLGSPSLETGGLD